MRPAHPTPARDAALLLARSMLGAILFVYGYQELDGLGRSGLAHVSIPVAIVSASVVTVVAVVCGLLLVVGLLTPAVAAGTGVVLVGAAAVVQVLTGTVAARGGWELVGAIVVALAALSAAGPGRISLAHVIRARRARPAPSLPPVVPRATAGHEAHGAEPIPPAGLPLVPLVRLTPVPKSDRSSGPVG